MMFEVDIKVMIVREVVMMECIGVLVVFLSVGMMMKFLFIFSRFERKFVLMFESVSVWV